MTTGLLKGVIGTGKPGGDMMKHNKRECQGKRDASPYQTRQTVITFQELDFHAFRKQRMKFLS